MAGEAKRGNEFEILVRYKSLIDVNGTVDLRIPQHAAFPSRATEVRSISEERSFARQQTRTDRFRIRIDESGNGLYSFGIRLPEAPAGYQKSVERWVKIHSTDDGFDLFDPLNPGDREPLEIGKDIQTIIGEQSDGQKGKMESMQLQSGQNYNVSVSGNIRFFSGSPDLPFPGVFGNSVVLWFRNSSDPGTWFHPVYAPDPVQGTHFDKLDEQGNFSFNFSFNGDLSGYDELIVLVNTANNAAIMPAPQDGYVSFSGSGVTAFFNESEGLLVPIDPTQTNITVNQNGEVNSQCGRVLRYSELSKEYLNELYGGNMTFTVPAIPTRIESLTNYCGVFRNQWSFLNGFNQSIEIDPACTEFTTVSHEFGHWSHYRMWTNNSKWGNSQQTLKEGFAIFFSFGTRNYANRNFGDALLSGDDNTEEAPFQIGSYMGQNFRFASIRAAHPINGEPGFAAAASYLWNLYDDPEDQTFLAAQYSQGDNDDINGHSLRVFEKMRTLGTTTISNYHSHFKSGLPSDEQSSVNRVYDFMFDDLHAIPQVQMRSAQVENFQKNINSGSIDFTWEANSYPSHLDYSNPETGYRLYRNAGSGWSLIQTLSEGTANYTYSTSNIYGDYRIASYNSEGNSANPPIISIQPPALSVHISGPSNMFQGSSDTFTANVSGGVSPYSYQWSYRHENDSNWLAAGTNSPTYNHTAGQPNGEYVRVIVTDGASQAESAQHFFTILGWSMVAEDSSLPDEFSLTQNYPNPFNPSSTIRYELPERAEVSLAVFNMLGQRVALLIDGEIQPGRHEAVFEASTLSSGNYIARFQASGISGERFSQTLNMQLVK